MDYVNKEDFNSWKEKKLCELMSAFIKEECAEDFERYCGIIYDYEINNVDYLESDSLDED